MPECANAWYWEHWMAIMVDLYNYKPNGVFSSANTRSAYSTMYWRQTYSAFLLSGPVTIAASKRAQLPEMILMKVSSLIVWFEVSFVVWFSGTLMCFGQTGAGKTYTMTGSTESYKQRGVIPRALQEVSCIMLTAPLSVSFVLN